MNVIINKTIEMAQLEGGGEATVNKTVASTPGGKFKVEITVVSQNIGESNYANNDSDDNGKDRRNIVESNLVERGQKAITEQESLPPI